MTDRPRAADLRAALIAETLDEVALLHDTVQALGPKLDAIADAASQTLEDAATQARQTIGGAAIEARQAIADAVPRAQQELTAHVHAQTHYVEQQLLKDREKFVNAQKAALEDFEERLLQRDAALTKIVAETFNKTGKQLAVELTNKGLDKKSMARWQKKQDRQGLLGLFIGLAGGSMATLGGLWLAARYTQ